jgi:hypothetical protein
VRGATLTSSRCLRALCEWPGAADKSDEFASLSSNASKVGQKHLTTSYHDRDDIPVKIDIMVKHRARVPMITVITTFELPKPITREEARRTFLSTVPKYQGVAGLFRKYYFLSQDRRTVGGIYLWNSRAEAEAMYTESWRAFVRDKYDTNPPVTYFDSPVVVDNVTNEILSDE